tara:strand:- start:1718 stop:1936 length:219 start_codon:yes stop_codon:yes gene_type:complete
MDLYTCSDCGRRNMTSIDFDDHDCVTMDDAPFWLLCRDLYFKGKMRRETAVNSLTKRADGSLEKFLAAIGEA